MAFPLLAAHDPRGGLAGLSFDLNMPLADLLTDPVRHRAVEAEISAALLPADGIDSFVAAAPGLIRLLQEDLPVDLMGTRAANILRSKRCRSWRDVAHLSPATLMAWENFGYTSLRQVADAAVHDSLDALLEMPPAPPETSRSIADRFRDTPASRFQTDLAIVQQFAYGTETLGDLAPELWSYHSEDPLPATYLPVRLQHRLPIETWGELRNVRLRDVLSMANVGTGSVGELLAAIRRTMDDLRPRTKPTGASAADLLVSTVDAIASWASEGSDYRVCDLFQLVEGFELPPRLRRRWATLAEVSLEALSATPLETGLRLSELLDGIDPRLLLILRERVWNSTVRMTLEELGQHLNMTRERVRQIEAGGVGDLRSMLSEERFLPIAERAAELRRRLGSAVPMDTGVLTEVRRWFTRDVDPRGQDASWELLQWLAGPYKEVDGWLVLCSGGPDPKGNDLRAQTDSAGFASHETITGLLNGLGIVPEWHSAWVERCGKFRSVEGGLLDSSGGILDQALRYLEYRGVPMTVEQILEDIGRTDASARGIRHRLFDHPRVARVSKSEVGLREWGAEEFTTIPDEMVEEIERAGGAVPLDILVEQLVDAFGVSPASIRMYAGRPMFIIDGIGTVRIRSDDEPYELRDDLSTVAGCYELTPTRASWRVRVDRDVLRGSGRHIPEQLAGWLRLRPGTTLMAANPLHPVPLSWRPWAQPDIGSLKVFAESVGAKLGDWLVLVFDRAGTVEVRLVVPEDGEPLERLAAMVGVEFSPGAPRTDLLVRLADAFEVGGHDAESLPFRIRHAIDLRRDVDIADLAEEALLG